MIPHEKLAPVHRALGEAFGTTEIEEIRALTRGNTNALVYRLVVQGTPLVLKIMMRDNAVISHSRQYDCMRAAAEAGLAPRVHYTSVDDGIAITDFIAEVPLSADEALARLPRTLRALHALPSFPGNSPVNTTCTFFVSKTAEGFLRRFGESGVLPHDEIAQILVWLAQIAAVYPHHNPDLVSSHNDLFKPDNILFDGKNIWLIDWEAAFLNDRYVDLATVANLVLTDEQEESAFLKTYFGEAPDEYQQARFYLMRQLVHISYTMIFLLFGSAGKPVDQTEAPPDFTAFHRSMWAGEVNLADNAAKLLCGRAHYARLVENMGQNMRQPRFAEALTIVSSGSRLLEP